MSTISGVRPTLTSSPVFGKYAMLAELGHGGSATVYLAIAQGVAGFNKLLVIKQLRPGLADDPAFITMFLDEARLAARLNHPNIVQTNEVGEHCGQYYIAMEYLEGQSLYSIVRRCRRENVELPVAMSLQILVDMLRGLHYAHELKDFSGASLGIVHRDVSPHNVFVTYEGQVKVVDFGIAKANGRSIETETGVIKGKVPYMSPEQAGASATVDRRTDVFAAGIMLVEALTGKRFWEGQQDIEVLRRLFSGDIPSSPRALLPDLDEELDAVCRRALALEPDNRHATAEELAQDIEKYMVRSGMRVTSADRAKLLTSLFQSDRVRIHELIDAQIKLMQAGAEADAERQPSLVTLTAASGEGDGSTPNRRVTSDMRGRSVETAAVAAPIEPAPAPKSRRWLFVTAGGVALGVVAAVVVATQIGSSSGVAAAKLPNEPTPSGATATAADTSNAPAQPTQTAPAGPAATTVGVRISADPPTASIYIDDALVGTGSFTGTKPKDDRQHQVRVVARGYATSTDAVSFANDVTLTVTLPRMGGGGAVVRPAATTAPPPTATTPSAPQDAPKPPPPQTGKPKPAFDNDDPWKH